MDLHTGRQRNSHSGSYEFKPLPGRRWIIAGPFKPLWRRYMAAALARCVETVESDFASSAPRG